jgi:putative exosortase-associated protein (TIGR04073 family)
MAAGADDTAATADDMGVPERMGRKALRGAVDVVTGVVEVPMQVYKGYDNGFGPIKNKPASKAVGTVLGFFRGLGHAAGRVTHGGRELVCFWSADQATDEGTGVPFDAEYSWEIGEQYSYFKPNLKEGVTPVGRKLTLGVANAFTGIVEVPNQIVKANRDGDNVVIGAGKGVYYFISRTIYGATDVISLFFLVPNQEDTYGYAYSSRYPWGELSDSEK